MSAVELNQSRQQFMGEQHYLKDDWMVDYLNRWVFSISSWESQVSGVKT